MYEELIQSLREKAEFLTVSEVQKAPPGLSIKNLFAETMSEAADAIEAMCEMVSDAYSENANLIASYEEGGRRTMKIKLDPGAKMPTRAHPTDAGLDLYAAEDVEIYPAGTHMRDGKTGMFFPYPCGEVIDTGVHIALDSGTYGKIESRSGLNIKSHVVSCGGVIDEGYTGSIKVKLYNFGSDRYRIMKGDKIAQLVIMPYLTPELEIVDELEQTERGDAGFGSTGK